MWGMGPATIISHPPLCICIFLVSPNSLSSARARFWSMGHATLVPHFPHRTDVSSSHCTYFAVKRTRTFGNKRLRSAGVSGASGVRSAPRLSGQGRFVLLVFRTLLARGAYEYSRQRCFFTHAFDTYPVRSEPGFYGKKALLDFW